MQPMMDLRRPLPPVDYSKLPETLQGGMQRWVEDGILPGHFLRAVIANDLREAVIQADEFNRLKLVEIVSWFWNECPSEAWGSPAKMLAWAKERRPPETPSPGGQQPAPEVP